MAGDRVGADFRAAIGVGLGFGVAGNVSTSQPGTVESESMPESESAVLAKLESRSESINRFWLGSESESESNFRAGIEVAGNVSTPQSQCCGVGVGQIRQFWSESEWDFFC